MRWKRGRASVSFLTLWLAAGVIGLAPGLAAAQGIRAGALAPQFKGASSTPELRDKFHDSIVRGLGALTGPSGPNGELGEVISASDARARLGEELIGCGGQASCLAKATAALRVNRLVATELTVIGKSYTISLRLYDGQGHELTHAEDLCEICTVREAEEAMVKVTARIAAAARTFPVEPVAAATPDRREPAKTPSREESPQQTSTASPMQEAPPQPTVVKARRRFPWRAVGFASLGLGIVGLAVGIPLVVIDGRPTCDAPDPSHTCPEVYNTAGGGAAMLAIGAIGLVASIPLLYLDWRSRSRPVSSLRLFGAPASGGATVGLGGTF